MGIEDVSIWGSQSQLVKLNTYTSKNTSLRLRFATISLPLSHTHNRYTQHLGAQSWWKTYQGKAWYRKQMCWQNSSLSWHPELSASKMNEQVSACGRQGDCVNVEIPRCYSANNQKFRRWLIHPAPSLMEQFQTLHWWWPTAAHKTDAGWEESQLILGSHATIKQTPHYLTFSSPDDGLSVLSVQTKHAEWFACKILKQVPEALHVSG